MEISRTTHPRWKWRVDTDVSYGLHAFEVHAVSDFQLRNFYHWAVSSWPRKLYKLFTR